MNKRTPIFTVDPDNRTNDELKAMMDKSTHTLVQDQDATIYDPTQEIVDRLDRIAAALEDQNLMMREEMRAKGYAIPPR